VLLTTTDDARKRCHIAQHTSKASGPIESAVELILDYGNGYWTDSVKLHNSFQSVQPPIERVQSLVEKAMNPSRSTSMYTCLT
jgi:hypothetical protein